MPRPPPPYPQRLAKQNGKNQFKMFIDMIKSLSINVTLVEALERMSGYAKFMKDLVTKKRSVNCETIKMTHQVSAIVHSMAPKLEDPDAFTIPCTIGSADFAKAFCVLGQSINLMPYLLFNTLGIGQPRLTSMRLQMADHTMKRPLVTINDVLVHVDKFILPAEFVLLDCEVVYEVPIILSRPSLATGKALVDVEAGRLRIGGARKEEESYRMDIGEYLGHKPRLLHTQDYFGGGSWTSPVQYVPKKGGMIVVTINKNELIPTRTVTGWRVCMDYRKLNKVTGKDHFSLPFLDQMLDRLSGYAFYCFLDEYSDYNKILIALEDQEKTTFTYPYGTFTFSWIPFGLCNASATF
ncbi:uncharacterized protein [Nicotiana sylvestris]|uniref:uncharacterized protein n=1 Tax=Nicotiana sylvestris TaxID=4096 RepID=UPI00388CBFDA